MSAPCIEVGELRFPQCVSQGDAENQRWQRTAVFNVAHSSSKNDKFDKRRVANRWSRKNQRTKNPVNSEASAFRKVPAMARSTRATLHRLGLAWPLTLRSLPRQSPKVIAMLTRQRSVAVQEAPPVICMRRRAFRSASLSSGG